MYRPIGPRLIGTLAFTVLLAVTGRARTSEPGATPRPTPSGRPPASPVAVVGLFVNQDHDKQEIGITHDLGRRRVMTSG